MKRACDTKSNQVQVHRECLNWSIPNVSTVFQNPGLSEDEQKKLLPSGSTRFQNKAHTGFEVRPGGSNGGVISVQCLLMAPSENEKDLHLPIHGAIRMKESLAQPQNGQSASSSIFQTFDFSIGFKVVNKETRVVYSTKPLSRPRSPTEYLWTFMFVPLKKLWETKDTYLAEDSLHVQFGLNLVTKTVEGCEFLPKRLKSLSSDMLNLFNNGDGADFTINCDGSTFAVHKIILAARSPVFSRMFATEMLEKDTNMATIDDVNPETLKIMLEFIYSSQVENGFNGFEFKSVLDLAKASDKYQMDELKDLCFSQLIKYMNGCNCGELAVVAYLHCASRAVRDKIYEYCAKNWFELGGKPDFQRMVEQVPAAFLKHSDNSE